MAPRKYCILRGDGQFYLGTSDHNALFGPGENAAEFGAAASAEARIKGLQAAAATRGEKPTFEVVPAEDAWADPAAKGKEV